MSNVKFHTQKDSVWVNAAGDAVPVKFVPKVDKVKESLGQKVHKAALQAEKQLSDLHKLLTEASTEVLQLIRDEYAVKSGKQKKQGKGAFTWFNFDRSIKIEGDVNDIVKWDGPLMTEAHELLKQYINANLNGANELIAGLVTAAFANTRGMIDSGKVFQILKYQDKIKNKEFQKACELMKQAQTIDRTKMYMRVWEKADTGEYRNINLNFSSI
jgi:hypothetical protein